MFIYRFHKTYKSYGPAVLILENDDIAVFQFYCKNVRPFLTPSENSEDLLLLTYSGKPLHNYTSLMKSFQLAFDLPNLPTFTDVRKAGSTAAIEQTSNSSLEKVSTHMSHTKQTNEKYYRMRQRDSISIDAFKTIQTLTAEEGDEEPLRGFANKTIEKMKEYFEEDISNKKRPTRSKCREFISKFNIKKSDKQVQDKVFGIIKQDKN